LKPRRPVFFEEAGGWVDCAIYERDRLVGGNQIAGPAIIEQMDTTTVVFPGQRGTVHASGILVIEGRQPAAS
jgi:N-methylhydantoinase A